MPKKFKVWNKKSKKMSPEAYTISALMDAAMQTGTVMFEEDFEFVQYTGLNDKNGKEIYENDVLEISGHGRYKIIWDVEQASYHCLVHQFNQAIAEQSVIIGNMYENPELLANQ